MPSDPFHGAFATNFETKFKPFSIELSNGGTLTGIAHIPDPGQGQGFFAKEKCKPLVVGIHGATCSAYTFDIHPEYTASTYSELFGIPFVAFHRPNFLGSSGWARDAQSPENSRFTLPEGSSYYREEARWYHEFIFPNLWTHFGIPNDCSSLVTVSHSMSVPVTVIAAGLYSTSTPTTFPWAGMILYGTGLELTANQTKAEKRNWKDPQAETLPVGHDKSKHVGPYAKEDKIALMLGAPGISDPVLEELVWKQNTPFFRDEAVELGTTWPQHRVELQGKVKIPVLYALGSEDWLVKSSRELVEEFVEGFIHAPRVEAALVKGAPHAIDMGRMGGAWWTRCFGWAVEVSVGECMKGNSKL